MTRQADRLAILRGMKAAEKLHRDLGSRQLMDGSVRVDVYDAIKRSGAMLMFKPLDPLLGAFMREGGLQGIIVTVRRGVGVQRFTAGHELGHLILDHQPHADDDRILRRAPIEGNYSTVPKEEREADAFASNFLLPKFLLSKLHQQQNWTIGDYENPITMYQASLRFGVSYTATLLAYERDNVITRTKRESLARVQPKAIKEQLIKGHRVDDWRNRDVWHLTERDEGTVVEADRADLFVLNLKQHGGSGYLWSFDELQKAGFLVLKDTTESLYPERIGSISQRLIVGEAPNLDDGSYTLRESRPWQATDSVNSITVHYRRSMGRENGLYIPQLDAVD
tara:strand:- start:3784 stop:4794 length:1011 start_codon:yes stop_codon:yes gene_type:complete